MEINKYLDMNSYLKPFVTAVTAETLHIPREHSVLPIHFTGWRFKCVNETLDQR